MNRKKYLIFTTMLSLLCMNKAYAACTQQDINDFKKVEDEFKVTYEFNITTKDYDLTFRNPNPDKYAYSYGKDLSEMKYKSGDAGELTYSGIKPGKYKISIIGVSNECRDELKVINISLSNYNKYSEDKLCEGIEEFVLCQKTYDKEIDYDTFVSRVNTYKKTKENNNKNGSDETNKKENYIIKYLKNNIFSIIIIVTFAILLITTIIITVKNIKKSRRLE